MATILIVDDEFSMREFLTILLEKEGFQTLTAADGNSALKKIADHTVDLLISDIRMPGLGGLGLLEKIKAVDSSIPAIMMTAYASPEDAVDAMKNGAYDYITKPFKVDEIKRVISSALATKETASQPEPASATSFAGMIGQSPEMVKLFDLIKRIAPTHANVMIYGESGTGKELVARAIHNYSNAANQPFVPITCSAIPESLIESELFGHAKGAFTGAVHNKMGLFEQADNGSAFLDEIGELTPIIQTKLLRVLQEREFKKVGGAETIKINVRIIAATNRDLEKEVIDGRFREDLFYRMAVVPLRLPPLRQRKQDIPLLVEHFLEKYAKIFKKDKQELSTYAMQVLVDYDYPGNVRELENIIERGVALESSNIILPESLTLSDHRRAERSEQLEPSTDDLEDVYRIGLDNFMAAQESSLIKAALDKTGNSKMQAAELLKISFRSLRYKVKKYEL